jgi:UDP:flavonoid glycosyltransferase YjiC (YdhE family)
MNPSPRLLLAVSGHGYGHLAQCAPVVNALWKAVPGLQLAVCGALPRNVIAARLDRAFTFVPVELDPVLHMHNAWEIDVPESRQAYRVFHRDWQAGLRRDAELLAMLAPDLVLADIPYRMLLAARQRDIPAVALCSLNWAAIYAACCGEGDADAAMLAEMLAGYRAASVFLAPEPALPMPELENYRGIGPIARHGVRRRRELLARLRLPLRAHPVLISLGGIATRLPLESWPRRKGVVWLYGGMADAGREDMFDVALTGMPFIDVLASSDAVLTKPGYGTYAEAVCNGIPILTLARPDWPETVYLNAWARRHGRLEEIGASQFETGGLVQALEALWRRPALQPPEALGIAQAVEVIAPYLVQV